MHVLNFNLYGGNDAPLVYQNFMFNCHKKMGFNGIMQDHCYLELQRGQQFIKFVVHVDDFLIVQRGDELWNWYLSELKKGDVLIATRKADFNFKLIFELIQLIII